VSLDQTWQFPSKRNPATVYTVVIRATDGRISCGCQGWIIKRPNKPSRTCEHVRDVKAQLGPGFGYVIEDGCEYVVDADDAESLGIQLNSGGV